MPQMGVSVSEGTITKWLKQEGEQVEADEPLLEISTDKVDTEVPSPGSGTLTQILVPEGETVEVGTKLAVIGGEAGAPAAEPEAPPEPATAQAAVETAAVSSAEAPAPAPAPAPAAAPTDGQQNGKSFVSPVVARIASEHGIDPNSVPGTGRGGRVSPLLRSSRRSRHRPRHLLLRRRLRSRPRPPLRSARHNPWPPREASSSSR